MFITPNGLHFHHENVLRQDLLLKPNHANITEVPRSCEIIVVPKALPNLIMTNRELAMEIPRSQRFVQAQLDRAFRSNPFRKKGVSNSARRSTIRGHMMYNSLEKILAVMLENYLPVEIRENSIQFPMDTEFCELFPELEDHFEIFEHIRGFNVTIATSANTQDETIPSWSGFSQRYPFSLEGRRSR
uniref:Ribosomal protein L5 n=2 Tax=Araucaria TaxID=25666 RepID=A0A0N6W9Q2_ARAHE|nr:ribosomal protein L5 [Araucaria heterophylla]QJH91752.1 ribosomal protein L5 [Araucaria heterophylla]QXE43682.1 ribosomal protein L5 [Araucaria cunninghamii]BDC46189.1 ribosomal protein L5 [Agathis dammara]